MDPLECHWHICVDQESIELYIVLFEIVCLKHYTISLESQEMLVILLILLITEMARWYGHELKHSVQ